MTAEEQSLLAPDAPPAGALAMRILVETARQLGASELVPITSAHIDGCLYHGESGMLFAERLRDLGGRVQVPASLNVGALDLLHPEIVRAEPAVQALARRQMQAYLALGCQPTWTCAPYQAGHRPKCGEQIAWAESNAVVFANSVLGARTERYGDFLDICAAIAGRAPYVGLHRPENRRARLLIDIEGLSQALRREPAFYPVLGSWLGETAGSTVAAIRGVPRDVPEDSLKALGAAAASTGAVGLFHVIGVTPEAATEAEAFGGVPPEETIAVTAAMARAARDKLSTTVSETIDCVALGSPHFSLAECRAFARLPAGKRFKVPVYLCTRRDLLTALEAGGERAALEEAGVTFVVDTCVVVTPILRRAGADGGIMMTNSGKFAHYGPANTGYQVVYGSLADCARSAASGRVERDESLWA
ncbi:MAG: aconitase X [Kiloniellales bacterium]